MNKLLEHARTLRRNMTDTEQRLWYHLRAHRFQACKFKRQKPLGPYIVDFVCMEHRLVIELDGGQHSENVPYDQRRDAWLHRQGFTVLRFWNNQIMQTLPAVLDAIAGALDQAPTPSPPAPFDFAQDRPLPQAGEGSGSDAAPGMVSLPSSTPGKARSEDTQSCSPLPRVRERKDSEPSLTPFIHPSPANGRGVGGEGNGS